jgi:hypothetical protein
MLDRTLFQGRKKKYCTVVHNAKMKCMWELLKLCARNTRVLSGASFGNSRIYYFHGLTFSILIAPQNSAAIPSPVGRRSDEKLYTHRTSKFGVYTFSRWEKAG